MIIDQCVVLSLNASPPHAFTMTCESLVLAQGWVLFLSIIIQSSSVSNMHLMCLIECSGEADLCCFCSSRWAEESLSAVEYHKLTVSCGVCVCVWGCCSHMIKGHWFCDFCFLQAIQFLSVLFLIVFLYTFKLFLLVDTNSVENTQTFLIFWNLSHIGDVVKSPCCWVFD